MSGLPVLGLTLAPRPVVRRWCGASPNELLLARVIMLIAFTILVDPAVSYWFYRLEREAPSTEVSTSPATRARRQCWLLPCSPDLLWPGALPLLPCTPSSECP
jgi:hypothetical protein